MLGVRVEGQLNDPPTPMHPAASSLAVARLLLLLRPSTTTAAARNLRPFTTSALDTARSAMEKSRQQLYAQWSQAELISRILELERPMET